MKSGIRTLVTAAVIGALYAALTLALAPISYGALQFRISEALCILPFFMPASAAGLAVGCAIANLIGPGAGLPDVVFGSLATLLAGVCTALIGVRARARGKTSWGACVAACLMPAVFNAPIIGLVIAYAVLGGLGAEGFWQSALLFGAQVGLGEVVVLLALGLPAMRYILRSPALLALLDRQD
ncbi:MAG: QueT transporter family protein [Bacillota bacterium]